MITAEATEEYLAALKQGTKEAKDAAAAGRSPNPAVLDEILEDLTSATVAEVGLVEIPTERIVGTRAAGRISAFSPSFLPLLNPESEFALKWKSLCADHLGDAGIREPILCYEYLGNFYVQEGNKRVSVLRHFGAARIPGQVKRILPPRSDDPRITAYYEFLEFYKTSKLYTVQFRHPGDYARLNKALGKKSGEEWTADEQKKFSASYAYFREAYDAMKQKLTSLIPEEALLVWLQIYPYADLTRLSKQELTKTLDAIAGDMITTSNDATLKVETKPAEAPKTNLLQRIITPDHVHVAFVHQLTSAASPWVMGHEEGRKHIEAVFGDKVITKSYFNANTHDTAEETIRQAVEDGAQIVFTTSPSLSRAAVKAAVTYPKVYFYNCSVDQRFSSIRTYYGRMYEAKFIFGAIAGALAQNDRIGYIAAYPIFGVPASINAFALGAQLTNPRAQIELGWSCCEGNPQADFFTDGIRVISNREVPTQNKMYLDFCSYGTYLMDDRGGLIPLGSPVWVWGKFYEEAVRFYLAGGKVEKGGANAVNYWLGMDSGVIGIELSDKLPAGIRSLAQLLVRCMESGKLDPFARKIIAQDGSVKNDGTKVFTPGELIHMDWLCENVVGKIPTFDQILPMSQAMVRELGIYKDKIPVDEEVGKRENFDRIR